VTADTPVITASSERFFNGWTVSDGITSSEYGMPNKQMSATIVGDVTVGPRYDLFTDYGVQIGNLLWASHNIGMPHAFAASHLGRDVWLYQYYHAGAAATSNNTANTNIVNKYLRVAWPSSGTIGTSNPGYDMATGAAVTGWQGVNWNLTPSPGWPDDYASNPCPEGWIVPTQAHWESLENNTDHARVPANGTITGYSYTKKDGSGQSVYMPLNPRRNYDNSQYDADHPQYMMNFYGTTSNQAYADWSVAANDPALANTAAARVIRCVRVAAP
jgi:hypothetical protein